MILDRFRLDGKVADRHRRRARASGAASRIGARRGRRRRRRRRPAPRPTSTRSSPRSRRPAGGRSPCRPTSCAADDLERLVDATVARVRAARRARQQRRRHAARGRRWQTREGFFETALRFNVTAPFLLTQLAARAMVDTAGGGAVVNISSRSSDMVQTALRRLRRRQGGAQQMTRNIAAELAPAGAGQRHRRRRRRHPVARDGAHRRRAAPRSSRRTRRCGRPGEPEDIACAALYLASPASSWVTGKVFQVDGGTERPSIDVPVPPLLPG